jgi:hypothetical protein
MLITVTAVPAMPVPVTVRLTRYEVAPDTGDQIIATPQPAPLLEFADHSNVRMLTGPASFAVVFVGPVRLDTGPVAAARGAGALALTNPVCCA